MNRAFLTMVLAIGVATVPGHVVASDSERIVFDGTLISYTRYFQISCGVLAITQIGRYRIDRLVDGEYAGSEVLVKHLACEGDVFSHVALGQRVRVYAASSPSRTAITRSEASELGYTPSRRPIRVTYYAAHPPTAIDTPTGTTVATAAQLAVAPEPAHRRQSSSVSAVARAR